jgi:hypothetical protein
MEFDGDDLTGKMVLNSALKSILKNLCDTENQG